MEEGTPWWSKVWPRRATVRARRATVRARRATVQAPRMMVQAPRMMVHARCTPPPPAYAPPRARRTLFNNKILIYNHYVGAERML